MQPGPRGPSGAENQACRRQSGLSMAAQPRLCWGSSPHELYRLTDRFPLHGTGVVHAHGQRQITAATGARPQAPQCLTEPGAAGSTFFEESWGWLFGSETHLIANAA